MKAGGPNCLEAAPLGFIVPQAVAHFGSAIIWSYLCIFQMTRRAAFAGISPDKTPRRSCLKQPDSWSPKVSFFPMALPFFPKRLHLSNLHFYERFAQQANLSR